MISDAQLIKQAQQGSQVAFEQLVIRHQRYVYNVAYRVLSDPHEAEDITQEAFVRAWKALPHFRRKAKFTTWIYRIVYNLCLNRLPKLQRIKAQAEPIEDLLDAPVDSPATIYEKQEQLAFLHTRLNHLPEKYRLVLSLRYLQQLSYKEIAQALDVPMGTVKTHIYRARQALANRVRTWETENGGEQSVSAARVLTHILGE